MLHINIFKYYEVLGMLMQSIPMSHIYYDFLKEKFCSGKYESNIIDEIIVKLQPEHIITTNYDHLLENVNDPSDTLEIRKKLIQNDKVEAIIVLPRELFITTDISVTLWILNQTKKGGNYHGRKPRNREYENLFMDLRRWTENPVKGESKKKVRLVTEQIEKAAAIYHTWQSEGTDGVYYEIP